MGSGISKVFVWVVMSVCYFGALCGGCGMGGRVDGWYSVNKKYAIFRFHIDTVNFLYYTFSKGGNADENKSKRK